MVSLCLKPPFLLLIFLFSFYKIENHFNLFPVEIAKLITEKRIEELQFSLTKGTWKTKQWQLPFRDTSPGFEINVWLSESTAK